MPAPPLSPIMSTGRAKCARRPQSAKGKGRRLQQEIERRIKEIFPHLSGNDVVSRPMGSQGADLIMSPLAERTLPYDFEMKNTENFSVWQTLAQCWERCPKHLLPCVVARRNRIKAMSVVPFGHYCDLLAAARGNPPPDVPPAASSADLATAFGIVLDGLSPAATLRAVVEAGLRRVIGPDAITPGVGDNVALVRGLGVLRFMPKRGFHFWNTWTNVVTEAGARPSGAMPGGGTPRTAMVFHRADAHNVVYIALPFETHMALLAAPPVADTSAPALTKHLRSPEQ